MRVLVVAPYSPTPVTDGYGVHLEGLLQSLRADHEVHLVCYGDRCDVDGMEVTLLSRPESHPHRYLRAAQGLVDGVPAIVRGTANAGLRRAVRELSERATYDVGHVVTVEAGFACADVDLPWLAGIVDSWGRAQRSRARLSPIGRRVALEITRTTAIRWERRVIRRADVVCVGSESDRQALLPLAGGTPVEVVANGVDTDGLSPPASSQRTPDLIVFHGAMDFAPNVAGAEVLARRVLPRIQERRPGARLRLVGRNPNPKVMALRGASVEVTGAVEDLSEALVEASAYACGLWHGSGVKNKVLEAAALGLPIVTTNEGVGSLAFAEGSEVMVRDQPRDMADALAELLADPDRAERLGRSARRRVEENYSRRAIGRRYSELYEQIRQPAANRSPTAAGS